MKAVKYVGDRGPVEIEVAPQRWREIAPGEVFEVADDLAASLVLQEGMWELAPSTRKKSAPERGE